MFKAEAEGRTVSGPSSMVLTSSQSLGPGGRKLKTVDSGVNQLFDEGEDGEGGGRRRELGGDGDMDEQVYEEDFADDEEPMEIEEKDDEAKEIEVYYMVSHIIYMMLMVCLGANEAGIQSG